MISPAEYLDGPGPPPPPLGSLSESREVRAKNMDDWRRFKEVGLLDEAAMVRKDHEALAEKASKLGTQLFDYQYNMGLLLMEKEEWASKIEELRQAFAETHEILNREQTAHLIALSEAEKREDNLRRTFVMEKQCVADLEKTLQEVHQEQIEVRHSSKSMLAEASALVIGGDEKSLKIEKKLKTAEAKLAEVNRNCMKLDIRLDELKAREDVLQNEQETLRIEREAEKENFGKKKNELVEWEQKLHEREERLCKDRRTRVEREEKVNEYERNCKQRETVLEELQTKIDSSNSDLKEKKEAISKQLEELLNKEKEADNLMISLQKKQVELHMLEEKLSAREKIEVKQLVDEHKATLDRKMQDFDLELEEKRRSNEKELSCEIDALRKKEEEIKHMEEKLGKREQAMNEKSERLKERSKESDEKLKSVKEREKVLKAGEKKLASEKLQLVDDKNSLQILLAEIEKIKDENTQLERKICEERENLSVINKEREEHEHLQSELKQETHKYRLQNELLEDKNDELKRERKNFEKQWEDLDEKKSKVSLELKELADEKEDFEKLQRLEENRLKTEKRSVEESMQRELENLRLEKDSFSEKIKYEQSALSEKARTEHSQMVHDFENQRRNLETELRNQREKIESLLGERERAFEDESERELTNIKHLKDVARKERNEVNLERVKVEKKREEVASEKGKLKEDQNEMKNDIDQLGNLSKKIKHQREELIGERSQFLAFVEKLKLCKNGGDIERELSLSGFRVNDDELVKPQTGEHSSWLQKCKSKIFNPSSSTKTEDVPSPMCSEQSTPLSAKKSMAGEKAKERPILDPIDIQQVEFEKVPEESMQPESRSSRRKPTRRSRLTAVEEAEAILGKTLKEPGSNATIPLSESPGTARSARKRNRAQTSQVTGSECDGGDSEACSGSVTAGGRGRKRRQIVPSGLHAPGEERYNFRPRKSVVTAEATAGSKKARDKEAEASITMEETENQDTLSVSSSEVVRKSSESKQGINVTTQNTLEFPENRVVRFKTPERVINKNAGSEKPVEIAELSVEVSNFEESGEEDESGSMINESDDDVAPGEASIGKKIWTFLST